MNLATMAAESRGNGGRRWLWLFAAAGALLLLALGHAPASAATSLTASPNPVLIYPGTTTGTTDLKWGGVPTAPNTKIALYVGADIKVAAPLPKDGKYKLTVTQGNTYVAAVRDMLTGQTYASVTVTAPFPGCLKNCFTTADVTPHGTFAGFNVVTAGQTKLRIEIGTQAPSPTFTFPNVVAWKEDGFSANHLMNLSTLYANTQYYYVIRAEDTLGFVYHRTGTFTTLKRKIDVSLTSIHVLDDSDDLSGGDLKFWFTIGGNPTLTLSYPDGAVDTGDDLLFVANGTIMDAQTGFTVKVVGYDDDSGPGTGLCSQGLPPFGSGSSICMDWITKETNINVVNLGTPAEAYSEAIAITLWEIDVPLKFQVFGTYTVSYI